ncbi:hypothetical protein [Glaciimonas sp. PAMC28666]|uniref:hypothetical protein n=1 Tax=Glaciimonas sp. PAMC28666 TaxID=2807626 RepID=UPI001966B3BE|nr:hypothetical protein [Glaciimonas sp. PAMC28666]QRX81605.1 hypothetical protein JQN73_15800 [Glaciimonas sp. PAMC28666]
MHPAEVDLIKKNAERFAKEFYQTDKPTAEQLQGAVAMLANTAQNLIDYNLGYDVPYFKQAESFLHTLQSEYASTDPTLSIGNGQYLFYATNDQKNSPYINSGYVDKEIAGVIIKAPIRKPEIPGENNSKRDPATNLPLDDEGRYAQQIVVDGKMHAPKYFPCPRASAGSGGQNLDMSDPGTAAYVKALDKKILGDIGAGASGVALAIPGGAIGIAAGLTGTVVNLISALIDDPVYVIGQEATTRAATSYLKNVLKMSTPNVVRLVALVDLAGGWSAFVSRMQSEFTQEKTANEAK